MTKTTVRNTTKGYRGFHAVDGYVELAPGETRADVELSDAERKSADGTGYFEFGAAAKAAARTAAPASNAAPLPNNVPKLKKLAKDEGIDLGTATTAKDITAAIVAARTAKAAAAPVVPPPPGPADDLDNMADDDLRTTTAAITGKSVDELPTDRAELLKLARGEK